jgi:nucleoid DNA-binding protein
VKYDDLLAQYLYQYKSLKLQGIGTFTLDEKVSIPGENEKEIYYPIEGLSFHYNAKDTTPESLVEFLVKKLGKIQPLVRSDLDSYLSNIKQFLNLGKPCTIEGIGTLHKNNLGTYEFTPGNFLPVKEELNPKRENPEHNYPTHDQSQLPRIILIVLISLASIAALGGIGWAVYHFLIKPAAPVEIQATEPEESNMNISDMDSLTSAFSDSDSLQPLGIRPYKMIFEITPSRVRAVTRTEDLNGAHKIPTKIDSVMTENGKEYRLYLLMNLAPADTASKRDSLNRFFERKIIIEKQ